MNIYKNFEPNYQNILSAAKNIEATRLPVYDHSVAVTIMEQILNKKFTDLINGNDSEKREFFRLQAEFYKKMGYDAVIFEQCAGPIMPGSGALNGHEDGVIKTRADFEKYPWDEVSDLYFKAYAENFRLLAETMPQGMKSVGGVGNGVFECVQDVVGYMELCYIRADDEQLFADLFAKVGDMLCKIWSRFLIEFGDCFCICRFGDDLGFKSDTLLAHEDVKKHIIPQYKRIVEIVHSHNKPFLLHSCGCIFDVMDEIIDSAKIDAKHSNEDVIAPFQTWVDKYGKKIGNFGGVDTDVLCRRKPQEIKDYVTDVIKNAVGHGGFALGSGNSVPKYVPIEGYIAMNEAVREYRRG